MLSFAVYDPFSLACLNLQGFSFMRSGLVKRKDVILQAHRKSVWRVSRKLEE